MYNILLVDDSDIERNGLKRLLERSEYEVEVTEACDGEKAWEQVRECAPDIIFTDIRMPIMDGIDLLGLVKNFNADIQIIVFSAYGDFKYTKKAIENKADNYILKPIDTDEFEQVLRIAVERVDEINANRICEEMLIKDTLRFDTDFTDDNEDDIIGLVMEAVSEGNFGILNVLIDELFAKLHEKKAMSMLYVRSLALRIIKKIYEVQDDGDIKSKLFHCADELIGLQNAELIEEYLKKIAAELLNTVQNGEKTALSKTTERAVSVIRRRYAENISLDVVSEEIGLSPKYFSRVFKREMGTEFSKYLTDYRMKKTAQKLDNTEKSVAEICRETGFSDNAYFGSVFKRHYGMTPGQWRKRDDKK